MAETKKHFDILLPSQNPTGTEQTFGQKIEELKTHPDTEITVAQTAEKISALKNEIETKISFDTFERLILGITDYSINELIRLLNGIEAEIKLAELKNFLDKNPGFEMEVKNKIHDLRNAPVNDPEKTTYENALFFLEISFRKLLVLDLKETAEETDLQKATKEFTKEWIASLEEMANGPTLEYHELLASKEGVYAPEVEKLLIDTQFLREAGKLAEKSDKKEFYSVYLKKWAEVTDEASVESATRFLNEARAMMLQSVGKGHLSQEDFREIWEEISNNPTAAELLKAAKNGDALENFNEWLYEKEEALIIESHKKANDLRQFKESKSNSNPYGFFLRRYGDLSSALLYAGRDILGGIILVNLALAKFNPVKILSNPVAWATIGGIGLIANHFNPSLFEGKTNIKKAAENDLKNKIENLREHHPKVREWLMKFGKSNIAENGKIGKLLAEKGRTSITSKEIEEFLDEDETPPPDILENSEESKLLFQFFKACQNENINPKNLENV